MNFIFFKIAYLALCIAYIIIISYIQTCRLRSQLVYAILSFGFVCGILISKVLKLKAFAFCIYGPFVLLFIFILVLSLEFKSFKKVLDCFFESVLEKPHQEISLTSIAQAWQEDKPGFTWGDKTEDTIINHLSNLVRIPKFYKHVLEWSYVIYIVVAMFIFSFIRKLWPYSIIFIIFLFPQEFPIYSKSFNIEILPYRVLGLLLWLNFSLHILAFDPKWIKFMEFYIGNKIVNRLGFNSPGRSTAEQILTVVKTGAVVVGAGTIAKVGIDENTEHTIKVEAGAKGKIKTQGSDGEVDSRLAWKIHKSKALVDAPINSDLVKAEEASFTAEQYKRWLEANHQADIAEANARQLKAEAEAAQATLAKEEAERKLEKLNNPNSNCNVS